MSLRRMRRMTRGEDEDEGEVVTESEWEGGCGNPSVSEYFHIW